MKHTRATTICVLLVAVSAEAAFAQAVSQQSATISDNPEVSARSPVDTATQNLFRAASEKEDPAAMYTLGVMFDEGRGVPEDNGRALQWYTRAAEHGHVEAMNRVGLMYANGRGVAQDYTQAVAWYRRAAENGSLAATGNLATAYFYGFGVPQSYTEAANLLQSAVARGNADAQNKLAAMYNEGLGVPQDHAAALKLLEQSAAQGFAPAMASLGRMYIEGLGVERDDVRGYALTRAALDLGVPGSVRAIATNELNTVTARLNHRQLVRAQRMAAQFAAPAGQPSRAPG